MTHYQREISKLVPDNIDPRHIEGYMRLQYDRLSHLTERTFRREVKLGVACIRQGGIEAAEQNAQSFGL